MLSKWFCISFLILIIQNTIANTIHINVTKYDMVYYNSETRLGLKSELEDDGRIPLSRVAYRGISCNCGGLTCGCCTGINITTINFDRHACTNFTYYPEDFAINVKLIMNEKVLLSTGPLSAKNPPPLCVPLYPVPFISFCVRFFDIYTSGKNLHTCIDFETHVVAWPILILHFDCIKIGTDGISWMKPEDGSNVTQIAKPEVSDLEVYDEVNFETESIQFISNQTSTLTPEEEASIGQLKL